MKKKKNNISYKMKKFYPNEKKDKEEFNNIFENKDCEFELCQKIYLLHLILTEVTNKYLNYFKDKI